MNLKRKIYISVFGDGSVIVENEMAGYIGENLASQLYFTLPENLINNEFVYVLNFEDKTGNVNVADIPFDTMIFNIPSALTTTESLWCQLSIYNNDNIVFKSDRFLLKFLKSVDIPENTQKSYSGLLQDTLNEFHTLIDKLGVIDVKGLKGIQSFEKTNTLGNIDTYTITYTDNTSSIFTIKNGENYNLTSSDKEEIAEIIFNEFLATANTELENCLNGGV